MKVNSVSLVYFSPTHTTQRAARAIAKGSGLPLGAEYDFTTPRQRGNSPCFDENTLVIVGVPVYAGRIPTLCVDYIDGLRGQNTPCVLLAVYGNRDYDHALIELYARLRPNGFLPMACGMFIGEHSYNSQVAQGRPNEADLAQAEDFGRSVMEKIQRGEEALKIFDLLKTPAGKKGVAPVVSEKCVNCGTCAAACPTGAINPSNIKDIDASKCIVCRACAKFCPEGAIDFSEESGVPAGGRGCLERFGKPDKENKVLL